MKIIVFFSSEFSLSLKRNYYNDGHVTFAQVWTKQPSFIGFGEEDFFKQHVSAALHCNKATSYCAASTCQELPVVLYGELYVLYDWIK